MSRMSERKPGDAQILLRQKCEHHHLGCTECDDRHGEARTRLGARLGMRLGARLGVRLGARLWAKLGVRLAGGCVRLGCIMTAIRARVRVIQLELGYRFGLYSGSD